MVKVHVFNRQGQLVGPVDAKPVAFSDSEWQRRLSPEQYRVLRSKGTERPFCGTLLDNKKSGVYSCAGCGLPLFSSEAKFNSGTGWPSFFQPIAALNVREIADHTHGMTRIEIVCARCEGHLGHVFPDGPPPTGQRHCLNSESLAFTPMENVAALADPIADSGVNEKQSTATAIFAGGCFWCTEAAFEQLAGVSDVQSGYIGGHRDSANYQAVCTGSTGHAEAIRITYDPRQISYDQLLDVFFDAHDPTQLNRQGADIGTQYRSAIFIGSDQEKQAAEAKVKKLNASGKFSRPIATTLEPLSEFFPAEDYHQDYAQQHPDQPYIQSQALTKACKVREKYPTLIRQNL